MGIWRVCSLSAFISIGTKLEKKLLKKNFFRKFANLDYFSHNINKTFKYEKDQNRGRHTAERHIIA